MNPVKRIINLASKYKHLYFFGIFFNSLYSIFSIFSLAAIIPVLNILFQAKEDKNINDKINYTSEYSFEAIKNNAISNLHQLIKIEGQQSVLLKLCIFVCIVFFIRNFFRYLAQYFIANFRTSLTRDLQLNFYKKILQLPVRFFTEQRKGDIINRMFGDVGQIDSGIISVFIESARAPFMIIASLISLFYIQPKLTIFALIVLPVMGTIIGLIGKSLKKFAHQTQHQSGLIYSAVDETLNAPKVIKIFNSEDFMFKKFSEKVNNLRNLGLKMARRYEIASPISEFLGATTMMIIVWFGGQLVITNQGLKAEDFLAFIGIFFQMIEPAKTLTNSFANLSKGKVSAQRYYEIIDTDIHIEEKPNAININQIKKGFELKNVSFRYNQDQLILDDVSFFIPAGKTVALVGQSGSGKTTLANLLARFYDVTSGQILVDGTDIRDLKISEYRRLLGMVTQESILFNDTILNNLLVGKINATEQEIINAAKVSNSYEFIERLPKQLDTPIGELGGMISGGQKQRISIARAVLKNPPIMILDEATSALDTQSEKYVQQALENLMKDRTTIIIAHRLSTIQKADNIIVLEQGKIIEQGNHNDLINKKGKYAKLVELQNFD